MGREVLTHNRMRSRWMNFPRVEVSMDMYGECVPQWLTDPVGPSPSAAQGCPEQHQSFPLDSLGHHPCCLTAHKILGARTIFFVEYSWERHMQDAVCIWCTLVRIPTGTELQPSGCKPGVFATICHNLPINLCHQVMWTEPTDRSFCTKLEAREVGSGDTWITLVNNQLDFYYTLRVYFL